MAKWTIAAIVTAVLLISSASVSAHNTGSNSPVQAGRKATRTPVRTSTPTFTPRPLSTATLTPAPTYAPTYTATPYVQGPQREQDTITLINQRRAAMGLGQLRVDAALTTAARRQSNDIGPLGLCQHEGTDGSYPSSRVTDAGYTGNYTGEVVGCGFASAQSVVDAWWASSDHYGILTYAASNDIGCGWWVNASGFGWVTCDLGLTAR